MRKLSAVLLPVAAFFALAGGGAAMAGSGDTTQYVIAFANEEGLPADVDQLVTAAGGTITARLPEIGGVAVSSTNPGFADAMSTKTQVLAVSQKFVGDFALDPELTASETSSQESAPGVDPQPGAEPLFPQQWDKMRMNVSATGSYAVQRGRSSVTVAVLDTGAQTAHPDIAPHLDLARSRSFVPTEPTIEDFNGHGTWCLSAAGAPINGFGISGVAPDVTLVALKIFNGNQQGTLLQADQALIYAGEQHFDVVSMSWGVLLDKSTNQADWELFKRALKFARRNDVVPIAALGNSNLDLGDGSLLRDTLLVPGEAPGVVGVSATGYLNQKAFYSNYGSGAVSVAAPGGDSFTQIAPSPYHGRGRVLGAWAAAGIARIAPANREVQCGPGGCFYYAWMQGTSMAAPNVAGVAALIISQDGGNKRMSVGAVESRLAQTANNQDCPDPATVDYPFAPLLGLPELATCAGGSGKNGFYGKGIVDALKAVTAR
jgi:subtilisin family serine protease